MRYGLIGLLVASSTAAGCTQTTGPSLPPANPVPPSWIEARAIKPPQQDVRVGSLYYARETPTEDFSKPVAIEPLCFTTPDLHQVEVLPPKGVASFDVTDTFQGGAGVSGIRTMLINAGLSGDLGTYYDLTLTNVTKTGITHSDAEKMFVALRQREDCRKWFRNVNKNFAIYQVESIYTGDLELVRKQSAAADGNISVALDALQPSIEAKLKSESSDTVSGQSLVFAIVPLLRNASAP